MQHWIRTFIRKDLKQMQAWDVCHHICWTFQLLIYILCMVAFVIAITILITIIIAMNVFSVIV